MERVRIVWGTGSGPTRTAAYDSALADANVHNYNLSHVSSIIPPDVTIDQPGTAPELGPIGGKLTVVEAKAIDRDPVAAGIGWATCKDGPGIVYESADTASDADVARDVTRGIEHGKSIRDWPFDGDEGQQVIRVADAEAAYGAAVVLAVFGGAEAFM